MKIEWLDKDLANLCDEYAQVNIDIELLNELLFYRNLETDYYDSETLLRRLYGYLNTPEARRPTQLDQSVYDRIYIQVLDSDANDWNSSHDRILYFKVINDFAIHQIHMSFTEKEYDDVFTSKIVKYIGGQMDLNEMIELLIRLCAIRTKSKGSINLPRVVSYIYDNNVLYLNFTLIKQYGL